MARLTHEELLQELGLTEEEWARLSTAQRERLATMAVKQSRRRK